VLSDNEWAVAQHCGSILNRSSVLENFSRQGMTKTMGVRTLELGVNGKVNLDPLLHHRV